MILDTIIWITAAILGCIGFVQAAAWTAIRASCKGNPIYRVIPIGGAGRNADRQMVMMYTCLQWESNPSRQVYVLYNAGLDARQMAECEDLAKSTGSIFIRTPEELVALLGENSASDGTEYLH